MTYRGHIENGIVVIDDKVLLQDGLQVVIEVISDFPASPDYEMLRSMPICYLDPFSPAVPDSEWNAIR